MSKYKYSCVDNQNPYYVYVFLDPRKLGIFTYNIYSFDYEPFYIGKGKDYRCREHMNREIKIKQKNTHKNNKIHKILNFDLIPEVYIIKRFKKEQDAFDYEEHLVNVIGRIDLKCGPLTNKKDGGGKAKQVSLETREKIAKANKGKKLSNEHIEILRNANKGNKYRLGHKDSEETRKKKGIASIGRKMTKENSEKLSLRNIGNTYSTGKTIPKRTYHFLLNNEIIEIKNLTLYCKEHNLSDNTMRKLFNKNGFYKIHNTYKNYKRID